MPLSHKAGAELLAADEATVRVRAISGRRPGPPEQREGAMLAKPMRKLK